MGGEQEPEQEWWRPVVTGLGALVAVSLVVGLVLGLVALGASRILGGGGGDGTTAAEPERLVLPETERTDQDRAGLHANPEPFVPVDEPERDEPEADASESDESDGTKKKDARKKRKNQNARPISISASPTVVAPMERVDLTGVYQGAEGVRVEVQRREGRSWESFGGISTTVSGGTFSTYVQTARQGRNRFRVHDPAADVSSAPVVITVG